MFDCRAIVGAFVLCCAGTVCASIPGLPAQMEELVAPDKPTVVVFLGVECPLAKLYALRLNEMQEDYAGRVSFVGLNPNLQDSADELREFSRVHQLKFPFRKDHQQAFAQQLNATRTPEAFLLSPDGAVLYRGRIDDQFQPGANRGSATNHYLRQAIDSILAGQDIKIPFVEAVGCLVHIQTDHHASKASVTYSRDIAPILYDRCVNCHRDGQAAPFSLTSYEETVPWTDMIVEVIQQGRMPPWGADRTHGRFANDPSLTEKEKQKIYAWAQVGAPQGDSRDLPPMPDFPADGWQIETDVVYSMPRRVTLPAEGIVEYQTFVIDPQLDEDMLIQAVQVRPGNLAVVHHATVLVRPRGEEGNFRFGNLSDVQLSMYLPGQPILQLPPGVAKILPAGCELVLQMHYITVGSEQTDLTQIGIQWANPADIQFEAATWLNYDADFEIPPHAARHDVSFDWIIDRDVQLRAIYPHMHLRGKSARITARYPNGRDETLLFVPHYDFNWQHRYELAVPKQLPKGTRVRMDAVFDNSSDNPSNPDPSVIVRHGERTTDEMCQSFLEICIPHTPANRSSGQRVAKLLLTCAAVLSVYCGFSFVNRRSLNPNDANVELAFVFVGPIH